MSRIVRRRSFWRGLSMNLRKENYRDNHETAGMIQRLIRNRLSGPALAPGSPRF